MMRRFGIIGYPLGHSFSRKYFTEKFNESGIDASYSNFEIEDLFQLKDLVKQHNLEGFNVTIPHKKSIIELLDSVSDEAARIGAVNCVKVDGDKLSGYNTDVYGFRASLLDLIGDNRPDALILGTGGASLAAQYVLKQLGMQFQLVSRSKTGDNLTYNELSSEVMAQNRLIINTSPLGTFPNIDTLPDLPYQYLSPAHYLFDMVYNPPLTRFLEQGKARGAQTTNGLAMLIGQAEKSWEIWNNR